jgi:hypothetical protein
MLFFFQMRLRTTVEEPFTNGDEDSTTEDSTTIEGAGSIPAPEMEPEAIQQIEREQEAGLAAAKEVGLPIPVVQFPGRKGYAAARKIRIGKLHDLIEAARSKRTIQLLLQIWQSDYSIIGFVIVMGTFYLMKDTRAPVIGLTFFLFAMAEVDAILSIFVVRLSFHQNKHGFYRTEDFERDWLRYRMMLTMSKAALLFVVGTSCGTATVVASYLVWFFTSTQRLRYIILRWSMDEHYPELQRWSIFALLREAGIEPKLKNFNVLALVGVVVGFGIVLLF